MAVVSEATYTASDIEALTGAEQARKRPGMYFGGIDVRAMHHEIWEIVDNSVDEAMAGFGERIITTLHKDGSVTVQDFGRGIPIGPMEKGPHTGRSALEVVMTELNAGGKFGGSGYKVSGGLHGVGMSVTIALSDRATASVCQDGNRYVQSYVCKVDRDGTEHPSTPTGPVELEGKAPRGPDGKTLRGTTITFWPTVRLFHDSHGVALTKAPWDRDLIAERFRQKSYINPGLAFVLIDERGADKVVEEWCSQNGVADLVADVCGDAEMVSPVISGFGDVQPTTVSFAAAWTDNDRDVVVGYANGIATTEGGTHVQGFRAALTEAVQKYIVDRGFLKDKESPPSTRDIFSGVVAAVSIMHPQPAFGGNQKGKLLTVEVQPRVRQVVLPAIERWLDEHPVEAKRVCDLTIGLMRLRLKSDKEAEALKTVTARGSKSRGGLPAKLRDRSGQASDVESEVWIVEGDSAGGTAVDARDPKSQAVLAIKGKPRNTYKGDQRKSLEELAKDGSLADIILSLGAGFGQSFDLDKMRYDRIVICADADVDGSHIRALLTGFFYRWMPGLIESGRLFHAMPPLFSTIVRGEKIYLLDEAARTRFLDEHPKHSASFGRLKGLGEMDAVELRATMSPRTRVLRRLGVSDPAAFDQQVNRLLGPKIPPRRDWIMTRSGDSLDLEVGDI
jgi:DNA gyrase subunit B